MTSNLQGANLPSSRNYRIGLFLLSPVSDIFRIKKLLLLLIGLFSKPVHPENEANEVWQNGVKVAKKSISMNFDLYTIMSKSLGRMVQNGLVRLKTSL